MPTEQGRINSNHYVTLMPSITLTIKLAYMWKTGQNGHRLTMGPHMGKPQTTTRSHYPTGNSLTSTSLGCKYQTTIPNRRHFTTHDTNIQHIAHKRHKQTLPHLPPQKKHHGAGPPCPQPPPFTHGGKNPQQILQTHAHSPVQ